MREYLVDFFTDFGYEDGDARVLLSAYDTIMAHGEAGDLLGEALAAYSADYNLNYEVEIYNKAKEITRLTALHAYTVELLVFICLTKRLKEIYIEQGIDMQIYRDSVLDLKWKLDECKAVKGVCGSFVAPWFVGLFNMTRFALGRLQFEIVTLWFDYEGLGIKIEKDKTRVISVHIPRTGTPMDKESCDRSYAMARSFFRERCGGEEYPFACYSWLLYPANREILSPKSNTYRFMDEYVIIRSDDNNGEDLWRLFDTDEKDPDKLPANTSMRRAYAEYLKNGGRVGEGMGIRKFELG